MLDSQQGQLRAQWPAPGRPLTGSQREGSGGTLGDLQDPGFSYNLLAEKL